MKVLFLVFLCLFSASAISNVAMAVVNTPLEGSQTESAPTSYLILGGGGAEPNGDGRGGGGHPK